VFSGWKRQYLDEKARTARLELELRQLNELIRSDYQRSLADSVRALNSAMATITTLRKAPPS
jgi:hypothetical protein